MLDTDDYIRSLLEKLLTLRDTVQSVVQDGCSADAIFSTLTVLTSTGETNYVILNPSRETLDYPIFVAYNIDKQKLDFLLKEGEEDGNIGIMDGAAFLAGASEQYPDLDIELLISFIPVLQYLCIKYLEDDWYGLKSLMITEFRLNNNLPVSYTSLLK